MKSFFIACLLVSTVSALQCLRYAQVVLGSMDGLDSWAYEGAEKSVNGEFGVAKNQTCSEGEKCVGDVYLYEKKNGDKAGFVWTSCWSKDDFDFKNKDCYWHRQNATSNSNGVEQQYRCVCNGWDNCQTVGHLHEQFTWVFGIPTKH